MTWKENGHDEVFCGNESGESVLKRDREVGERRGEMIQKTKARPMK